MTWSASLAAEIADVFDCLTDCVDRDHVSVGLHLTAITLDNLERTNADALLSPAELAAKRTARTRARRADPVLKAADEAKRKAKRDSLLAHPVIGSALRDMWREQWATRAAKRAAKDGE